MTQAVLLRHFAKELLFLACEWTAFCWGIQDLESQVTAWNPACSSLEVFVPSHCFTKDCSFAVDRRTWSLLGICRRLGICWEFVRLTVARKQFLSPLYVSTAKLYAEDSWWELGSHAEVDLTCELFLSCFVIWRCLQLQVQFKMFPNCSCLVFDLNCFSFHCIAESSVGKTQKSNWQAFIIVYADSQRSSQRSGRNVEATSSRLFSVLVGTVWDPL